MYMILAASIAANSQPAATIAANIQLAATLSSRQPSSQSGGGEVS